MTSDCELTFKQWLNEHLGLILKVARAYGCTAEDQDDLFQEICLQIWLSIPLFAEQAKVSTWIYRVALNTALVWNRGEKKKASAQQAVRRFRQATKRVFRTTR